MMRRVMGIIIALFAVGYAQGLVPGATDTFYVLNTGLPSAATMGDTLKGEIVIRYVSSVANPFNGDVDVYLANLTTASGNILIGSANFATAPLQSGDTARIAYSVVIQTPAFTTGENIVVVWPVDRMGNVEPDTTIDTIQINTAATTLPIQLKAIKQLSSRSWEVVTTLPLKQAYWIDMWGRRFRAPIQRTAALQYKIEAPDPLQGWYRLQLLWQGETQWISPWKKIPAF